ncbi:ribonuclease III [Helicobacter sp. MIT 14-3879]|uniref:ribonuclease III n=1 Tax=Helicobacter sp. MIT 14-3879 TaxID=2040649 RepID=UPI0038D24F5E
MNNKDSTNCTQDSKNHKQNIWLNDLEILQKSIKYNFNNQALLIQALTHKSYNKTTNNERLEFLGDAVLDLLIGEYVFNKLKNSNEGDLTKLRAAIVNENSFTKLANAITLGQYLFISQSEIKNKGRFKPSILSDAFEALIGAVYIDGGLEYARNITYHLLELVYKEIDLDSLFVDYKTALQELTQAICGVIPEYELIDSSGPDHNKSFTMQVKINNMQYAIANGKSKKEAEQMCAKEAYFILKKR